MLVAIGRQIRNPKQSQDSKVPLIDAANYLLAAFPPMKRVRVGQFESAPVHCVAAIICYLKYDDALQLRLVTPFLHQVCRKLRTQWKLFPLTPGRATEIKYNRIVAPATGLVAVEEAFQKGGLRIYTPTNRKQIMDFQSGFCSALSTLYGPLFCFQYEEILRSLFRFYASQSEEIDKAAFIDIVTQIEEVRLKLRTWGQCTPFAPSSAKSVDLPAIRIADNVPRETGGVPLPNSLRLVENAQQQHLTKLIQKFTTL